MWDVLQRTLRQPVVLGFLLASLFPPGAGADDLMDVYRLSLLGDARMRAARNDYLAAREALPQARGAYLPNVALSYDHLETTQEIPRIHRHNRQCQPTGPHFLDVD